MDMEPALPVRHGLAKIDLVETLGNRSAEVAVGMVIEDLAAMRAGDHEQWPILLAAVIEQHTDGQDVVIGVGIKGPVLMPFDGSAKACRLHVELRAVQADVGTEQAGEHCRDAGVAHEIVEVREMLVRGLDASQLGGCGTVSILKVVDVGVRRGARSTSHNAIDLGTQLSDLFRRERLRHHHVPILAVEIHLVGRQHTISPVEQLIH
jgi:hypothetical protein